MFKLIVTRDDMHYMIDRCYDYRDRKQRLQCLKETFEFLLFVVRKELEKMDRGDGHGG